MKKGPAPSPRKPTFYQIWKRVASEIFDAGKENGRPLRVAHRVNLALRRHPFAPVANVFTHFLLDPCPFLFKSRLCGFQEGRVQALEGNPRNSDFPIRFFLPLIEMHGGFDLFPFAYGKGNPHGVAYHVQPCWMLERRRALSFARPIALSVSSTRFV